jgi:hypothetical protein
MLRTRIAALALLLSACAGQKEGQKPSKPEAAGPMAVAGARCSGGVCACRRVDERGEMAEADRDEGPIAEGHKRFELRTGRGLDEVRITVEGKGTLVKTGASPEPACAYVDLPPGRHKVTVRAVATNPEAGQEPSFFIAEHSPEQRSWYDTFRFRCGGGDMVCSQGHMDEWLDAMRAHQKASRGIYDPCGSTRVALPRWTAERAVGPKLADLEVELTLEVYKFQPRFPHGAKTCKGPSPAAGE